MFFSTAAVAAQSDIFGICSATEIDPSGSPDREMANSYQWPWVAIVTEGNAHRIFHCHRPVQGLRELGAEPRDYLTSRS